MILKIVFTHNEIHIVVTSISYRHFFPNGYWRPWSVCDRPFLVAEDNRQHIGHPHSHSSVIRFYDEMFLKDLEAMRKL
jgi:hypothetical protein